MKEVALPKINNIPKHLLGEFIKISPIQEVTNLAINYFITAKSFNSSFAFFQDMILPLSVLFSKEQVRKIVVAFNENGQISGSGGIDLLYAYFFRLTNKVSKELKAEWEAIYQYYYKRQYGEGLQQLLLSEFPEFNTSQKASG